LVINSQREEISARILSFLTNDGYENSRISHVYYNSAVSLTSDPTCLKCYFMFPELETLLCRIHVIYSSMEIVVAKATDGDPLEKGTARRLITLLWMLAELAA
jgi:hypothetical protein